ncbi:hypothetical protein BGZ99_002422 [Dissophora globulifera]|uniref:C2H2-type domain-containing protein n=1 Tax=Dissophora globulifera TaxID=979702 RepID=A0A9P6UWD2_9FUNG|nr:hypothetical protein BGZ99_002422 [Dissophora globulifera]
MPSSVSSSACPSPMTESFMPASALNNTSPSPLGDVISTSKTGSVKVKRNNSVCSTTRCNKSFSRSDNFSAHLRTHSKIGSDRRRQSSYTIDGPSSQESTNIKHEALEHELDTSSASCESQMESGYDHVLKRYASGPLSLEPSESGVETSPINSPKSSQFGIPSPIKDEEGFDMNHSSYPFESSTVYSMDSIGSINGMVPQFDTIRLDFKSVAPCDIHKQTYGEDLNEHGLLSAVYLDQECTEISITLLDSLPNRRSDNINTNIGITVSSPSSFVLYDDDESDVDKQ